MTNSKKYVNALGLVAAIHRSICGKQPQITLQNEVWSKLIKRLCKGIMLVHLHTASAADKSDLLVTTKRETTHPVCPSLHLTHDLTSLAQALYHLDAFLPSPDRVVAFLQQVVELIGAVHVF